MITSDHIFAKKHIVGVSLSDTWNGLVKILPIHESAKLPPNLCPILSDNLHWSEIEAAGMKSWSESARQSIKFILFGVVSSSLAIGAYLGPSLKSLIC